MAGTLMFEAGDEESKKRRDSRKRR